MKNTKETLKITVNISVKTMEAMTIMGMAASQARFLGLTARKSNVEYQGQQVNQQRTALSNESANLYNEMMDLNVPTPPSTSDYYKTVYKLDNSSDTYASEDYTITNVVKTYAAEGEYLITLSTKTSQLAATNTAYKLQHTTNDGTKYNFTLTSSTGSANLTYDSSNEDAYKGDNGSLLVNTNQIYKLDESKKSDLKGYNESVKEDADIAYFYQDANGVNHFLTQTELDTMKNGDINASINPEYAYTYTKETSTQVKGFLETSSSGRYSSITIEGNEDYPENLNNRTFSLSCEQTYDENAYNDAYNDYEFEKTTYEKTLADLNAKTELLQEQDQRLELKLKQLDTEENALKTEMDSVKEVLKNNVESTFKTFA